MEIGNTESIIAEIVQAFSFREYPGDNKLCFTRPEIPEYEGNGVKDLFLDKRWQDITDKYLIRHYKKGMLPGALAFLTHDAFLYYLPAFLILSLRDFGEWYGLCESLCFYLSPSRRISAHQSFAEDLSVQERRALDRALENFASLFGPPNEKINPALRLLRELNDIGS